MGLAPQVRRRIRAVMGRRLGLQKTGNTDIVYDMNPAHQDPDNGSFMSQVKAYRRFFGNWSEATRRNLERAWQAVYDRLERAQHPRQVAKGPVTALQRYLKEHNREELKRAERWERIERINKRTMLSEVQNTMDWKPWQQLTLTLTSRDSAAHLLAIGGNKGSSRDQSQSGHPVPSPETPRWWPCTSKEGAGVWQVGDSEGFIVSHLGEKGVLVPCEEWLSRHGAAGRFMTNSKLATQRSSPLALRPPAKTAAFLTLLWPSTGWVQRHASILKGCG